MAILKARLSSLPRLSSALSRIATRASVFAAVLVAYLCIASLGQRFHGNAGTLVGDEPRYIAYAEQLMLFLIRGGNHTFNTETTLYSGPGYPMFLTPLLFLGFNFAALKLANAVLATAGCFFIYRCLSSFLREPLALGLAVLTVLHPKLIWHSSMILTETYAFFLGSLFCYAVLIGPWRNSRFSWILPAIVLSQLILTKVLFAYVVVLLVFILVGLKLFMRRRSLSHHILTCIGGLALCTPFLVHTYNATGRPFYWLWSGGSNLYWMSTPCTHEYGDWMGAALDQLIQRSDEFDVEFVYENHRDFFETLPKDDLIETDLMFKRQAVRNTLDHPFKFGLNVGANILRIFTDHPNTYDDESPRWTIWIDFLVGIPLLLATIAGSILAVTNVPRIPNDELLVLLTCVGFIAGLAPLASFGRMLIPALPMLIVSLGYVFKAFAAAHHREPVAHIQSA